MGSVGSPSDAQVRRLTRRGLHLAIFTVAYNLVEGAVAIASGVAAGLVVLVGFGFDSLIESASAVVVTQRLTVRLRGGPWDARRERRALRAVAVTLFLLAAYLLIDGAHSLITGSQPEQSPVGVGVLVLSVIVMPLLAHAKRRVGMALGGDELVLADAAQTRVCVLLSISTLIALLAFALTGAAWIDPVMGFAIAIYAAREGREAWEGRLA